MKRKARSRARRKIQGPVAVYLRVSTEKQDLETQKLAIEKWLKSRGLKWRDLDYVFEEIETGKEDARPQFRRLWSLVKEGKIGTVIVFELSRLSRRMRTLVDFLYDCAEGNVQVVSVRESFFNEWMRDPKARTIIVGLLGILYELEQQFISERIKVGLERARREGKKIGGQFKLSKKEQQELVKMYKEGMPIARIARRFGVSRMMVYRYLQRAGIKPKGEESGRG